MSSDIRAGQVFEWTGRDQRTGETRTQTVFVDTVLDDGRVIVQDEASYGFFVPASELTKPVALQVPEWVMELARYCTTQHSA